MPADRDRKLWIADRIADLERRIAEAEAQLINERAAAVRAVELAAREPQHVGLIDGAIGEPLRVLVSQLAEEREKRQRAVEALNSIAKDQPMGSSHVGGETWAAFATRLRAKAMAALSEAESKHA